VTEQDEEPSMEDILSSIRKILSDDMGELQPDEEDIPPEPIPDPAPPAAEDTPPPVAVDEPPPLNEEDVINLTKDMEVKDDVKTDRYISPQQQLVSPPVQQFAACKLAEFAKFMAEERVAYVGNGKVTLEQVIKELLRPMLKDWLDANLESVVEKMVEKEIQRVGEKIKLF